MSEIIRRWNNAGCHMNCGLSRSCFGHRTKNGACPEQASYQYSGQYVGEDGIKVTIKCSGDEDDAVYEIWEFIPHSDLGELSLKQGQIDILTQIVEQAMNGDFYIEIKPTVVGG